VRDDAVALEVRIAVKKKGRWCVPFLLFLSGGSGAAQKHVSAKGLVPRRSSSQLP
jgi:hypothetical protein